MDVYRHTHDLPDSARGGVVAIGNFDGLHRGHRGVLAEAQARARALGVPCNVMTFEPHPRRLFKPDQPPFRLSALRTRLRLMEALGIDNVFVLQFDWDFAKIPAEDFVTNLLVRDLQAAHVVVGRGFRFGYKRQGDIDLLTRLGETHGFGVSALDAVQDEHGETISSSRVRACLQAGEVREAQRLLGRPWEVEGRVEHGAKRGREIGFPTANVPLGEYLEPMHGIYAVRAGVDNGPDTFWMDGAGYIGTRPSVHGDNVLLEVSLFDVSPDLYNKHLRVQLIAFLRGDHTFDSMQALSLQIAEDCRHARRVLENEPPVPIEGAGS
ncbi:bifunctional riboflavin kinase/FAD synthetase [Rhodovibrio salinarum]|uniref:Riboflavin biosynthesis protein n=1 Tax=Rhodovibrio salinarum TaxID=1087 RepID=A0A934QMP4_9PROT|nr:bifunctional riboflavin kinase/FAD synthetase [Rhodovibrio salinarum]MBK1699185.1 bifunctional riboflavin kinase/FMN adenylyltransferase [Rhodovibrio salinarum]